jgi:Apea-like HEPN
MSSSESLDILSELCKVGVDDRDIHSVMLFAAGEGFRKQTPNKVEYWRDRPSEQLFATLRFEGRRVKSITPGPLLNTRDKQELFLQQVSGWLGSNTRTKIWMRPLFAQLPLRGKFLWKNCFQIRPLKNFDMIGKGLHFFDLHFHEFDHSHLGPPFPFVLEVAVPSSENMFLENSQGLRLLDRYECLLAVLLTQRVASARSLSQRNWTGVWSNSEMKYHILSGGFDIGEDSRCNEFSDGEWPDVPIHGLEVNYYNHLYGNDGEIHAPPNLGALLEAFDGLHGNTRDSFLRACHWFSLGIENSHIPALSILSFSTAIECLLPRSSNKKCTHCEKPVGPGPTQLFKNHLEKYAPISSDLKKWREELYNIRSALIHGSRLDATDFDWLAPQRSEHDNLRLLHLVARRSLVNWLADPARINPA